MLKSITDQNFIANIPKAISRSCRIIMISVVCSHLRILVVKLEMLHCICCTYDTTSKINPRD